MHFSAQCKTWNYLSSELQIAEFLVPFALRAPCTRHYLMMVTVPVLMEMLVKLETGAFSAKLQEREDQTRHSMFTCQTSLLELGAWMGKTIKMLIMLMEAMLTRHPMFTCC